MKALKKRTSVYQFLEESGVLEKGTVQEITQARRRYWSQYKREWRRQKRRNEKELTPSFTKDELKMVGEAASKHHTSRTRFIKQATLAYISKAFIIPDGSEVRHIRQLLAMNYNLLKELLEENKVPLDTGKLLLQKILDLEHTVLVHLYNPKTLEQWIAEIVSTNPHYKAELYRLLISLP